MKRPPASDDGKYRYKLRLTAEQTETAQPSILINRHQLFEADSLQSPEISALADYSRQHTQMTEKDRYVLAFSLLTVRQLLGRATKVSSRFSDLRACLDEIDRDMAS